MWTWRTPLKSPESRPSPPRRSRGGLGLDEGDLSWSCTRCPPTDSAQVPRVQGQVHRGAAEVNLALDEGDLSWSCTRRKASTPRRSRGVLAFLRVQLQRNVDEEGGKYTEAMAEVYLPPSESTLQRSRPSPPPPAVGLMISTPTASKVHCSINGVANSSLVTGPFHSNSKRSLKMDNL